MLKLQNSQSWKASEAGTKQKQTAQREASRQWWCFCVVSRCECVYMLPLLHFLYTTQTWTTRAGLHFTCSLHQTLNMFPPQILQCFHLTCLYWINVLLLLSRAQCVFLLQTEFPPGHYMKYSVRALQVWWVMAWPKLPSTSSLRVLRQRTAGCHQELLLWRYYREYQEFRSWCTNQLRDVKENSPLQISLSVVYLLLDSRILLDLDTFRLVWKWKEYLRDWFELSMHVFLFFIILLYLMIFQFWTEAHDFWTRLSLSLGNQCAFFTVLLSDIS